jgi:osmotically-inducible protein OsmY
MRAFPRISLRAAFLSAGLALAGSGMMAAASPPAMAASTSRPLSAEDEALRQRVVLSLQEAPYFYDGHVIVTIEKGAVVLGGLVFSDWDLRDAIRIATKAAEGRRVVDNLSIVEGGRR